MKDKVSVIIPVYNGEAFIGRAIDSVLNQSIKPFELIVVNDGSKDGTAKELAKFGDNIKVITIPNGGVSNARNTGILTSAGDLIAFLDADDVWYVDKLKLQLQVFKNYPEVGFSCCDYEYSSSDKELGATLNHFSKFKNDKSIIFDIPLLTSALEILIRQNFVGTCSNVVIKRTVLDRVGLFNVNYKQAEDYDLWLRCSLVTQFVLQSAILVEKKSHDANLTNNFLETLLFHEQVLISLNSNINAKEKISSIRDQYHHAIALVRYDIANLMYENEHPFKAFRYFFLGLGSIYSFNNFKIFSYFFTRKLLRTISFGLIKKRHT